MRSYHGVVATERNLEELIAEFIERREAGEELSAAAYLSEHGDRPELADALAGFGELDRLLPKDADVGPQRIGPYMILGELGRGGAGIVLDAVHVDRPEQPIALKVLSLVSRIDSRAVKRFRREGGMLASFRHENVVRVLDVGAVDGNPYIAMERVDGATIRSITERARAAADHRRFVERLDLPGDGDGYVRTARVLAPLAHATEAAHARSILHRDIKPGNVVLRRDGVPVLLDFGLASVSDASGLTHTGDVLGTPQYMAPEQARGMRAGVTTDVYGLGTVLFELVSGRPPHQGTDSLDLLERVRRDPVPPLRRIDPEAPRDLESILLCALAFDPSRRYESAAALAEDLEAFAAGRPVTARRPNAVVQFLCGSGLSRRSAVALILLVLLPTFVMLRWGIKAPLPVAENASRDDAVTRALVAWVDEDDEAARSLLERHLAVSPDDPRAAFLLTKVSQKTPFELDDPSIADLVTGDGLIDSDPASALRAYGNAVEASPGDALAVAVLALAAFEKEAFDLALAELQRAKSLLPQSDRLPRLLAELERERALSDGKRAALMKRVEEAPNDELRMRELALALHRSGDGATALATARAAPAEVAKSVLVKLGAAFDHNLDHSSAQETFREVLAMDPNCNEARFALAYSFDIEHKARAAALLLEEVARRVPKSVRCHIMLANIYSGASRGRCSRCNSLYRRHPDLLDPERTVRHALAALRLNESGATAATVCSFCVRVGKGEALRPLVEERIALNAAKSSARAGRRLDRYRKALRVLDGG